MMVFILIALGIILLTLLAIYAGKIFFPTYFNARVAWKFINSKILANTWAPPKCIGFVSTNEKSTFFNFFKRLLKNELFLIPYIDLQSKKMLGFVVIRKNVSPVNKSKSFSIIHTVFLSNYIEMPKGQEDVIAFLLRVQTDLFFENPGSTLYVKLNPFNPICDVFREMGYYESPRSHYVNGKNSAVFIKVHQHAVA